MKAFRFTLESLRQVRERQEQQAMERFALALLARKRTLEDLDRCERDLSEARFAVQQKMLDGCEAHTIAEGRSHCDALQQKRDQASKSLAAAELATNEALNAMNAARQAREVVEKLYHRHRAVYRKEAGRMEQNEIDELAGNRALANPIHLNVRSPL